MLNDLMYDYDGAKYWVSASTFIDISSLLEKWKTLLYVVRPTFRLIKDV